MPLYQYYCDKCDYNTEESYKVVDRDIPVNKRCPICNEGIVKRAVGCGGFELKGFCWARDNYSRLVGNDPNWSPDA